MFSTKNPKNSENPRPKKKEKKGSDDRPMHQGLSRAFVPTLWPSYMGEIGSPHPLPPYIVNMFVRLGFLIRDFIIFFGKMEPFSIGCMNLHTETLIPPN